MRGTHCFFREALLSPERFLFKQVILLPVTFIVVYAVIESGIWRRMLLHIAVD